MDFKTFDHWDEGIWSIVSPIYQEAFGDKGAKPEKVIRNMFRKQLCFLHVAFQQDLPVGLALTGKLKGMNALVIDYIAVAPDKRGHGIGSQMLQFIMDWSTDEERIDSIVIEVESEMSAENQERIHFWKKNGFTLTDYIHRYIWVPETYQAMYLPLSSQAVVPESGEKLFKFIGNFHKQSFQGT
ncbi:N-acetyltransferase [Bacillus salipaludis]|uniref:GNAT family N-acetyltransferase n=1 Tax=Bacillus salipaludis TaxID=2547811 RepID=UPI003D240E1F